jgi:hypothetical protein
MIIRIGRSKRTILCSSIRTQEWDDGLDIELFDVNGKPGKRKLIELPQDTTRVSVLDGTGKVIKTYTWQD